MAVTKTAPVPNCDTWLWLGVEAYSTICGE